MSRLKVLFCLACVLGSFCLIPGDSSAQPGYAQYGQYPPGYHYPDYEDREYRKREKEYRREERRRMKEEERRERAYQQWYNEEWRRHNQRYFGGNAMTPYPGESYESYVRRVQAQCNILWDRCARYCNTIRDPYHRAACVGNCNNELNECNSRF